jgi:hypothetical protein
VIPATLILHCTTQHSQSITQLITTGGTSVIPATLILHCTTQHSQSITQLITTGGTFVIPATLILHCTTQHSQSITQLITTAIMSANKHYKQAVAGNIQQEATRYTSILQHTTEIFTTVAQSFFSQSERT